MRRPRPPRQPPRCSRLPNKQPGESQMFRNGRLRAAVLLLGLTKEEARTTLTRVFQESGMVRQGELEALLARMAVRQGRAASQWMTAWPDDSLLGMARGPGSKGAVRSGSARYAVDRRASFDRGRPEDAIRPVSGGNAGRKASGT